jgi:predicted permease
MALGASRGRLIQQFLAESLMVAVLGCAAAAMAWSVFAAMLPSLVVFDPSTQFVPTPMPLLYSAALSVVVAVACGLAPAMRATQVAPIAGLKSSRLGYVLRGLRLQNVLVGVQVGFSCVLLTAAFVLLHAFLLLRLVDPGYDVVHTAAVQLTPVTTAPVSAADLRTVVEALPGVEAASYGELPLGILPRTTLIRTANSESGTTQLHFAGPRFLATMRIPLDRGRDLNDQDVEETTGAAGTVVNATFAQRYFGGTDPIGQQIVLGGDSENGRPDRRLRIVGVARNTKMRSLADEDLPVLYLARRSLTVVVRLRDAAAPQARMLERAAGDRFPGSLIAVRPMSTAIGTALLPSRVAASLLSALGAIGLTLAMIGLHGVISYGVTRRSFEIGVRVALGATRVSVVRLILESATRVVAIGSAIGVLASLVVLQALRPFLAVGQNAMDPLAIAGVGLTLVAAGAAASLWPARRAASVDPTVALRSE